MTLNLFDLFIEPFVHQMRRSGLELCPPAPGMLVLDVGCGTGTTLRLYQRAGCRVHGIDSSPKMLVAARRKLGPGADLRLGDAARMPYADRSFDLVTATLALHEMGPDARAAIAGEIARVLRADGRAVLTDFHPGPRRFPLGTVARGVILFFETLAGREHLDNGRGFLRAGGLPGVAALNGLAAENFRVLAGGAMAVLVLRHA